MEASDKLELVEIISNAWANVSYPGDQNIFTPDSYDDEGITEYFSGTTWKGHKVERLRGRCSAISGYFTPEAYHYWLPAYLIAAVEEPLELSQGVESLVASVTPGRVADLEEKMALFTYEQKMAVIKVLEYLVKLFTDATHPECTKDEETALAHLYSLTSVA